MPGSDPTWDLRGALTNPTVTHYGAVTNASEVGDLRHVPTWSSAEPLKQS